MERGIVIPGGTLTLSGAGYNCVPISKELIRYYLMYWDNIVVPDNNLISFGVPDQEDLISYGAITRPKFNFSGAFQGDMVFEAVTQSYSMIGESIIKNKSMDWVMSQMGNTGVYSENLSEEKNILRVDLANMLPVPSEDTHIANILEFKDRRSSELEGLHSSLDELYEKILSSPDQDLATTRELSRLKEIMEDISLAGRESFSITRKFDLSAELNIDGSDLMKAIAAGGAVGMMSGLTVPVGMIGGAVVSAIKVKAKHTTTFTPASENMKLAYLANARTEGIIS